MVSMRVPCYATTCLKANFYPIQGMSLRRYFISTCFSFFVSITRPTCMYSTSVGMWEWTCTWWSLPITTNQTNENTRPHKYCNIPIWLSLLSLHLHQLWRFGQGLRRPWIKTEKYANFFVKETTHEPKIQRHKSGIRFQRFRYNLLY